jgi:hypothetical protein
MFGGVVNMFTIRGIGQAHSRVAAGLMAIGSTAVVVGFGCQAIGKDFSVATILLCKTIQKSAVLTADFLHFK